MRKSVPVILLIAAFLLVSCGPAVTPAAGPVGEGGEVFTIALPRIVVDFNAQGQPSVMGLDLNMVTSLTGMDFSKQGLNKFYIDWMRSANVQHVELRNSENGVYIFVNGKAMPYLGWSDASLQRASDLAGLLNIGNTEMVGKFLPIVRRLGLDLVLRFPSQPGQTEIPLAPLDAKLAAKPSSQPPSTVVQFEVKYDQSGTPAILGITPYDFQSMGLSLGATNLDKSAIAMLQKNNIQSLELRGKQDGLYVYVNGEALPNLVWDDTFLTNAAQVYGQMNDQRYQVVQVITQMLPLVNKADVGVLVHFPVAAGQAVKPARMHQ